MSQAIILYLILKICLFICVCAYTCVYAGESVIFLELDLEAAVSHSVCVRGTKCGFSGTTENILAPEFCTVEFNFRFF